MAGSPKPPPKDTVGCDDLCDRYSSAADDGETFEKKREASMLFSIAEGHLHDEDYEEALTSAADALSIFRDIADLRGVADAQRVVIHAHRGKARNACADGDLDQAKAISRQAESIASDELEAFRSLADKRGEAAMRLALAEVNCDSQDGRQREDALDYAEEALASFGEVADSQMEAMACLVLARVRSRMNQMVAARRACNDALTLFRTLGDKKREAVSWNRLGSIAASDFCYEEAIRCGRKEFKLAQELGNKRMQACAMFSIAQWMLRKGDYNGALSMAGSALELFQEVDSGRGKEASAAELVSNAHLFLNDPSKAAAITKEFSAKFRDRGDRRQALQLVHQQVLVHQADRAYDEALRTGQEALELSRELDLKAFESRILESLAYVHVDMGNASEAKEAAAGAVQVLKDMGAIEAECKANMFILARILFQVDDYGEAVKASDEALRIARESGERTLEGQAMLATCATHAMNKNYDKAIKAGELAVEIFREIGNNYKIDEAKAWQTLSEIHLGVGEISQALRASLQAEAVLQNFGDRRRLAQMKHTRVKVHMAAGEFAEAAKAAMEALKICRSEDDLRGIAKSLFSVIEANVELLSDEGAAEKPRRVFMQGCEKAIRFAKEAIGVSIKTGDRDTEASAYVWVAHLQIMVGKLQEAKQAAETAQSVFEELGEKSGQAQAMSLAAQADMHKGDSAAAAEMLQRALACAREAGDDELAKSIAELQARIAGAQPVGPSAPVMAPVADAAAAPDAQQQAAASTGAVETYVSPDPAVVKSYIMSLVANMTGSSDEVDGDTPLMESGIDSLASVELRTQLQAEFRVNLPSTVMFNYPTISTMTELLVDECTSKKISWSR